MDFSFFGSLSKTQAAAFLTNYLSVERQSAEETMKDAMMDGVVADFSIESIPVVLKWMLRKVQVHHKKLDASTPKWIRESGDYDKGFAEFDEPSKVITLRASYYLGEAFVTFSERLSWAYGDEDTAEQNMPVVTGFLDGIEMAPIMIVENLFLRILEDGVAHDHIDKAINAWLQDAPKENRE